MPNLDDYCLCLHDIIDPRTRIDSDNDNLYSFGVETTAGKRGISADQVVSPRDPASWNVHQSRKQMIPLQHL